MGIVNSNISSLGLEVPGIVIQRGRNVRDLVPGDRVFISIGGCFSTGIIVSEKLCIKISDYIAFQDAATMPERILNLRNASFPEDIERLTGGRVVDIVLNSLSGELLHASWSCVLEFGKMIEIGIRDLFGNSRLALNVFELSRSYPGVDLGHLIEPKPREGNSSISGMYGNRGQANYAAANTFLEAFLQYRRSLGSKAGVIDVGAIIGSGYLADSPVLMERLMGQGICDMKILQIPDALTVIFKAPDSGIQYSTATSFVKNAQLVLRFEVLHL
ncbi:hypothetical protein CORC01_09564 [Colletotrichum orchidophilum]|uniref:Enoyl reductase (ER) domain-containing protein n=1 Tax=Colletotrichum orchidophilum TaxID=1209926 RepID=A0A1G4B1C3_9PEZI|nr:uncharacterized protein CORC01_09564 [Colletotrichum orchidophilum]OHE95177.1 hypothetical protein CORC01_09564 [Colletotrichum orchidophilum]